MGHRAKEWHVRPPRWHVFVVTPSGKLRRPIDHNTFGGGLIFGSFNTEQDAWDAVEDKADELPNREICVLPTRYVGIKL